MAIKKLLHGADETSGNNYYICDIQAELPAGYTGDIAYTKDTQKFFIKKDAGWVELGGGGSGTPGDTVTTLDGTNVPGVATEYSRADHKHNGSLTPLAHATSHQPGGGDAMAVDAASGTGSLRTLGTGAAN